MLRNDKIQNPSEPLVECPACGLPAEITDRFTLDGAPAPVEHVKVVCVTRHWFVLPADQLRAPSIPADRLRAPSIPAEPAPASGTFRTPLRVFPSSRWRLQPPQSRT